MSTLLSTLKGEGNGGIARYESRLRKEQRTCLRRNVRRSIRFLVMGSTLSAFRTPSRARSRDEAAAPSDDDEEDDIRPAKRRKVSLLDDFVAATRSNSELGSRRPFGQVTNEKLRGPRLSGKIQAVQPSDFYGKSCSVHLNTEIQKEVDSTLKITKPSISEILPRTPTNFKKALLLNITSVVQKPLLVKESTTFARGHKKSTDIKCRCTVALFFGRNDDDLKTVIRPQDYAELLKKSSICYLRTTINDGGKVEREFINLEPFIFPAGQFFVNRKKRDQRGQLIETFDFAEKYYVQVTLERVAPEKEWPPFDLSSLTNLDIMDDGSYVDSNPITNLLKAGDAIKNDLYLFCQTTTLLDPSRQNRIVDLKVSHGPLRQKIPYALRLEMKWSLPSPLSDLPARDTKVETESPRAKAAPAPAIAEAVAASPSTRKGDEISTPDSPADARAQRRRANVPTYNLKTLSALQQGKSPRIRKSRDVGSRSEEERVEDVDATIVTYAFGKADSADFSIKRETIATGLYCPFCGCNHNSLDDLRLHLHMSHSRFKFSLRRSNPQRIGFFVELAKQGLRGSPTSVLEQARIFQLRHPRTLFDLEKFLNGDDDWVKCREGPQHNFLPEHLHNRFHGSPLSSSPPESRHSSPNTSNDTDDVMDSESYHPKMPIKERKKYYVPRTSKPLYDTITKQVLQPGEEIPNSDDEKDEGWLHQKHRDIIKDFSDVTDDEKDYITRWNPFVMAEQLTCETYLPDVILRFVETNKFWFAQKKSRKKELAKAMEAFMMRGVVADGKCLRRCIGILKEAEKMEGPKDKETVEKERLASPAKLRGILDCECGEHVQASIRVICCGKLCPGRFFHRKCAEKSGRSTRGPWFCDCCVQAA